MANNDWLASLDYCVSHAVIIMVIYIVVIVNDKQGPIPTNLRLIDLQVCVQGVRLAHIQLFIVRACTQMIVTKNRCRSSFFESALILIHR